MKRFFPTLMVLAMLLALPAGCSSQSQGSAQSAGSDSSQTSSAPTQPEYTLTFGYTHAEGTFGALMCEKMADLIEGNSGGRIQVERYPCLLYTSPSPRDCS